MKEKLKEGAPAPKKEKKQREPATPISEPALPVLLTAVSFSLGFIMLLIDRFIFPIGSELLSPVIAEIICLALPAYLLILLTSRERSTFSQMREVGFRRLRAEYIFFIIFSALLVCALSLILTLSFGGAYDASSGITLLGIFRAGENEFSVSPLYLIAAYAVIPAIIEEFFFRGVIFSGLEKISFPFAALVSALLYAISGFSLGSFIPLLAAGLLLVFVYYTTRSLWACIILRFLFELYRLFVEANVAAYFLSSANTSLLLITVALAFLVSAILFLSEALRIFRARAAKVAENKARSASRFANIGTCPQEVRAMLAYKPTLIMSIICLCLFAATIVINYLV